LQTMSVDEIEMQVVNGSEIILDDSLLNNSIQVVTVNRKQLLISAFRPTPDDEVRGVADICSWGRHEMMTVSEFFRIHVCTDNRLSDVVL